MPKIRHNIPLLLVAAVVLLLNRLLLACGLRKRRNAWRRAARLVLRSEASHFVLSAFALDPWPRGERPAHVTAERTQEQIAQRLRASLAGEPACCVRIVSAADEAKTEPSPHPSFTLSFAPWVDGPARFLKPTEWNAHAPYSTASEDHPAGTSPLIHILCRIGPRGECDLWLRINHIGADGVPMQEALTRLESEWGSVYPVLYPAPEAFAPYEFARPSPGREGLAELQFFADFAPLLAWRKRQNASLPEPMTVSAALLWQLGHLPELKRFRFGTTVDVAATSGLPRAVGVVVCRASDHDRHPPSPPAQQLKHFVRGFNRDLDLNRRRASFGCGMLDASALMPASLAAPQLRFALTKVSAAFGSIGLTMLKDARVFGTPIADVGHWRGFIAIGGVSLPCEDGRPGGVGCVTVKCDRKAIDAYPRLIRAAIAACADDANA